MSTRAAILAAYQRLTDEELVLFLTLRSLHTSGTRIDLVSRLTEYDIRCFNIPATVTQLSEPNGLVAPQVAKVRRLGSEQTMPALHPSRSSLSLPFELLADVIDHLGDWELAKAIGVPTSLPRPRDWNRATPMDHAIITGSLPKITSTSPPFSRISAIVTIRFAYLDVLDYLFTQHRSLFDTHFGPKYDILPTRASQYGRIAVLDWWKTSSLPKVYDRDAVDLACKSGQVAVLEWWARSGFPILYSEAALENASAKGHVAVLDWWKNASNLPLKVGRVMDMASASGKVQVLSWWLASKIEFKYDKAALYHASCSGRVNVLQWWFKSGLQMIFDSDALVGATRYNRPEVLEWWDQSKLPIQYRICDIEEALEEAIGGGDRVKEWWMRKGVNFNATDAEWVQIQTLN